MYKNHADLIGFIGSDPEMRQLENGTQLTSLSLATKASWKNDASSYDSKTEWHRIVVWGKLAQFASILSSGAHIEVEGQLRHRTFQKQIQAGKKTVAVDDTVTEIHASAIRKLDRSANSGERDVYKAAPEYGVAGSRHHRKGNGNNENVGGSPMEPAAQQRRGSHELETGNVLTVKAGEAKAR